MECGVGLEASERVPGESTAWARACAFAFRVSVRWRRVGVPAGSESDGSENDDELGGGVRSA